MLFRAAGVQLRAHHLEEVTYGLVSGIVNFSGRTFFSRKAKQTSWFCYQWEIIRNWQCSRFLWSSTTYFLNIFKEMLHGLARMDCSSLDI